MGRARKSGKRTKSGQLSRAKAAVFDHGTESAQARRAAFHGHGYDAIGRAFEAGLLGWEDGRPTARAKMLMDMAQDLNRKYWRHFGGGGGGCTLGRGAFVTGKATNSDAGLDAEAEARLMRLLAMVPHREKRDFDALVIDFNPDFGPVWLDRLIAARRGGPVARADDVATLEMVVRRLDLMVG